MFTYITLGTRDHALAVPFYDAVLAALGYQRRHTNLAEGWVAWGAGPDHPQAELVLWLCTPFNGQPATAGNGTMIAFSAETRLQVDAFHQAGIEHGGRSQGLPGLRSHYAPNFYAAYLSDPDDNKLAAVCRAAT